MKTRRRRNVILKLVTLNDVRYDLTEKWQKGLFLYLSDRVNISFWLTHLGSGLCESLKELSVGIWFDSIASIYLCYFRSFLSFLISTPSVWSIVLNFCHSQSRNLSLPSSLLSSLPPILIFLSVLSQLKPFILSSYFLSFPRIFSFILLNPCTS